MAFGRSSSSSKDVKKASFYVWFLGAKEAKGLRGEEFVVPVLHQLLDQERILEPSKVTLIVSNKGMKIVQNVPKKSSSNKLSPQNGHLAAVSSSSSTSSSNGPNCKMEEIKSLIPHDSITCVVQEDDIVCCLLLIFNPVTKCPVHVHGYRCDSIETAASLKESLQTLIDRPENQKKFAEIEKRLAIKHHSNAASSLLHHHPVQVLHAQPFLHNHASMAIPPPHLGAMLHPTGGMFTPRIMADPQHRRSAGGSSSDGRSSTRTEGSDDSLPNHSSRQIFYPNNGSRVVYPSEDRHHQAQHQQSLRHSSSRVVTTNGDKTRMTRNGSFVNNNNNETAPVKNKSPLRYQHKQPPRHHHYGERDYEMDINDDERLEDEVDPEDEELLQQKQEQFESLAQELKVKLSSGCGPILLPPRDYDTVSRGRGNLSGIEQRKSTNKQIVGVLAQIKAKQQRSQEQQALQKQTSSEKTSSRPSTSPVRNNKTNNQSRQQHKQQLINTNRSESSSGKSSGIGSDEALAVIPESSSSRKSSSRVTNNTGSQDNLLKKSSEASRNGLHSSLSSSGRRSGSCQRDSDDEHDDDFNNDRHHNHAEEHGPTSLRAWKILSDELRERGDIPPPVIPSHIHRSMATSGGGGDSSSDRETRNAMKLKSSSTPPADKTSCAKGDTPKYYFPDASFKSPESSSKMMIKNSSSTVNDNDDRNQVGEEGKKGRKKSTAPSIPSSTVHNIYLESGLSSSQSSTNNSRSGSKSQQQVFPTKMTSIANGSNNGVKSRCYPPSSSCIVQETGNMSPRVSSSGRHVILDTNLCKLKQK